MILSHYIAHQQALIKNNICIAVLSFPEHDESLMQETFAKFNYDQIVDLCIIQKDAFLNASWDGQDFHINHFSSWILGEDLKWYSPVQRPGEGFWWDENNQEWVPSVEDKINGNI
jgi:hypothetical protein